MPIRRVLSNSIICEVAGVALCEYVARKELMVCCYSSLKDILFYVHQNYLLICDAIMKKLELNSKENTIEKLNLMLKQKRNYKPLKQDIWQQIAANNKSIDKAYQDIYARISIKDSSQLLDCINIVFREIDRYTVYQAKETIVSFLNKAVSFS